MNFYTLTFRRHCPVNTIEIEYTLRIASHQVQMVEEIQGVISELPDPAYHEDLADTLARRLPGRQYLSAHHHGVDILTWR